jgi:periplasmic nitrate reductase NapD
MLREIHISSLVVHARPQAAATVRRDIAAMPGAEIHAGQGGKIVVTLETSSETAIVTRLNEISLLPGVLSAVLVFHQVDDSTLDDL